MGFSVSKLRQPKGHKAGITFSGLGGGFSGPAAWSLHVSEHTEQGQVNDRGHVGAGGASSAAGPGNRGVMGSALGLCLETEFGKRHEKFRFWSARSGVERRNQTNRN